MGCFHRMEDRAEASAGDIPQTLHDRSFLSRFDALSKAREDTSLYIPRRSMGLPYRPPHRGGQCKHICQSHGVYGVGSTDPPNSRPPSQTAGSRRSTCPPCPPTERPNLRRTSPGPAPQDRRASTYLQQMQDGPTTLLGAARSSGCRWRLRGQCPGKKQRSFTRSRSSSQLVPVSIRLDTVFWCKFQFLAAL